MVQQGEKMASKLLASAISETYSREGKIAEFNFYKKEELESLEDMNRMSDDASNEFMKYLFSDGIGMAKTIYKEMIHNVVEDIDNESTRDRILSSSLSDEDAVEFISALISGDDEE